MLTISSLREHIGRMKSLRLIAIAFCFSSLISIPKLAHAIDPCRDPLAILLSLLIRPSEFHFKDPKTGVSIDSEGFTDDHGFPRRTKTYALTPVEGGTHFVYDPLDGIHADSRLGDHEMTDGVFGVRKDAVVAGVKGTEVIFYIRVDGRFVFRQDGITQNGITRVIYRSLFVPDNAPPDFKLEPKTLGEQTLLVNYPTEMMSLKPHFSDLNSSSRALVLPAVAVDYGRNSGDLSISISSSGFQNPVELGLFTRKDLGARFDSGMGLMGDPIVAIAREDGKYFATVEFQMREIGGVSFAAIGQAITDLAQRNGNYGKNQVWKFRVVAEIDPQGKVVSKNIIKTFVRRD